MAYKELVPGTNVQALDSDLTALAAQSGTNTVPVRTEAGTIVENDFINQTNYTATVTLVGGAGNTVPVYSTNVAYYAKYGKTCFVWVYKTGDGGAEGAGTGVYTIALPFQSATTSFVGEIAAGTFHNGAASGALFVSVADSATTAQVTQLTAIGNLANFTGADQDNTSRKVTLAFKYTTAS